MSVDLCLPRAGISGKPLAVNKIFALTKCSHRILKVRNVLSWRKLNEMAAKPMPPWSTGPNQAAPKPGTLMCKMAIMPDWHTSYPYKWKFTYLRHHSSSCRVYSRDGFQNIFRLIFQVSIHDQITLTVDIIMCI